MPRPSIASFLVTTAEMQQIEQRLFAAGMPVAALMEKVAGRITDWFTERYSEHFAHSHPSGKVGVLAGPGHNGGDALVVARELHHQGFEVMVYQPFERCKSLTEQHAAYARHLGISFAENLQDLSPCEAIIDGWFGFGLTRPIEGSLASDIEWLNQGSIPVFSIDLPSGIETDTGAVLGIALQASYTACLGLWKRAFMQAEALPWLGQCDLIDFDIPLADITAVVGPSPSTQRLTPQSALSHLPLRRQPNAHKYTAGHVLVIAGSRQYGGAALLTGLGAIASGVGMMTLAVPETLRLTLLPQLPGALLVGCPETAEGAIAQLPDTLNLSRYDAIALGPGLTTATPALLAAVQAVTCPLLLDADGLNLLALGNAPEKNPENHPENHSENHPENHPENNPDNPSNNTSREWLRQRPAPTVITPHMGEFKRLFPELTLALTQEAPGEAARQAAQQSQSIVLLKGPRSAIAQPGRSSIRLWFNPHSTPALARGGSGDVLTGLMGGLMATAAKTQRQGGSATNPAAGSAPGVWDSAWDSARSSLQEAITGAVLGAVWWHSQAALFASEQRTVLGVDPVSLAHALNPALQSALAKLSKDLQRI